MDNLRETIFLKETGNSERDPDIAISLNNFDLESPPNKKSAKPNPNMLCPITENHNAEGSILCASFTNKVAIPDHLTLSKACLRKEN